MNARWESVAEQVAGLSRAEFGRALQRATSKDRKALLRARFRHRVDEFAEWVIAPILRRSTGWSPLTDFHRAVLHVPEHHAHRRGIGLDLTLAPRGVSKTTSKKIAVLHAALYQYEAGVAVVCASHREATSWVDTIRGWASEPEITSLYGSIAVEGTQTDLLIHGMPVWARGWSGSIRGLNRRSVRPTWIILDDIESERTTRTESARDTTQADLSTVIVPLGPTQGGHRIDWLATPAHHDAVASRVVRQEPGLTSWQAHRFPAVIRWPDDQDTWDEAKSIYLDLSTGLTPDERWGRVVDYLDEHPSAFEDAETIDAHRLPIAECYRRRWDVGELAWAREYDVLPTVPGEGLFEPDLWPRFRLHGDQITIDGRTFPWRSLRLTAAWDPSDGGDDGAIAVMGRESSGRCYLLESRLLPIKASLQAKAVVEVAKKWALREFVVEENMFGSLGRDALDREAREQGHRPSWLPLTQSRNKEVRIGELEAPTSNGLLAVRDDIPVGHLRQFSDFDPRQTSNRDDLIDAVQMAFERLRTAGPVTGHRPIL